MYCILITGIPAAGKSTMASILASKLNIPEISKDRIKEYLYDELGFSSRQEKVKLGNASMHILYYVAENLMKVNKAFILENNFENVSRDGILNLLEKYSYTAITISLTGDYEKIYQRFLERNVSPDRHRGHVVNDQYPEKQTRTIDELKAAAPSYENFVNAISERGMDRFCANGPQIVVDVTDFAVIDYDEIVCQINELIQD